MGTGFLMGVNIFHRYGFGIAKPDGLVPVAISTPDSYCSCPVLDSFPYEEQPTVGPRDRLAHRTPDSPVCPADHWRDHVSREDCAADRWLTGQSGEPQDSPVNYSHVAFIVSRERRVRRG